MKVLALELSTARGSLAWLDDDQDIFCEWPNDRRDSGPLFEHLADILDHVGAAETIIVGLGPGSYAGVRIAISTAIGMQTAGGTGSGDHQSMERHGGHPSRLATQLLGYPSICAMDTDESEYYVIGDARRQTFFFASIRDNALIENPTLMSEAELRGQLGKIEKKRSIFASEGLSQFKRAVICYPSARVLARLARDSHRHFLLPPLEPMYLREPHITMPKAIS
jgi:tRNA threonylcarbamoyl adenosine modification protein YeaZ